jgi:hypothetical protein
MKAILLARVSTSLRSLSYTRHGRRTTKSRQLFACLEKYYHNKNLDIMHICSFDESAYTEDHLRSSRSYAGLTQFHVTYLINAFLSYTKKHCPMKLNCILGLAKYYSDAISNSVK